MEQFIKENSYVLISIAVFVVWFVLTCINSYCNNKNLYIAEIIVLFVNIICDICLAVFSGISPATIETTIELLIMAAICAMFAVIVLGNFYENCYKKKRRK